MAQSGSGKTAGKVMLGCGGLLLLVALGVTLFCAFHVFLDPRGAISRSEAMPGLLAGSFFDFIALVVLIVGGVLAAKKGSVAAAPGGDTLPSGTAGAASAKPFPAHFLVGCGTLMVVLMSCGSCGGSLHFFNRADRYDRWAEEDARSGRSYSFLGPAYYRRKATTYRTYGGVMIGAGVFLLLVAAGAGFGTSRLAQSYKRKLRGD